LAITLAGADVDNTAGELTYAITIPPAFGSLAPSGSDTSGPDLIYAPAENYHGADSFTFVVSDPGQLSSEEKTFALLITPVNDAPTVVNLALETGRDTPLPLTLNGLDVDGDALVFAVDSPTHGSLALTGAHGGPDYLYTPASGFADADDSFTF